MFACIVKAIIKKYDIDTSDVFVDGTKLEANANKYKFVWKPRQRHDRLNEGLKKNILNYFPLSSGKKEFTSKEVAYYLSQLEQKIIDAGITIVCGSGHRQPQIVKDFHSLKKMLLKRKQENLRATELLRRQFLKIWQGILSQSEI